MTSAWYNQLKITKLLIKVIWFVECTDFILLSMTTKFTTSDCHKKYMHVHLKNVIFEKFIEIHFFKLFEI